MTPDPATPAPDAESGAGLADDQAPSDEDANPATNGNSENEENDKSDQKTATKRKRPFWRDLAVIVIAALVLTILLKAFVVQVFSIPSGSMENTLLPGDRILVNKMVYRFRPIEPGDIVVFSGSGSWDPPTPAPSLWGRVTSLVGIAGPGTDYVKRVIGVPGDHVVCCNALGQVTVNGVALSEKSYIYPGATPSQVRFNITVPAGRLWVMGDNRADSDDSRYRTGDPGGGTIPESDVVGRAFLIIWPLSRISDLPIPNTFEQQGLSAAAAVATAPPAAVGGGVAALSGGVLVWRRRRRS
ncbi:MAG TPA: signal peptidase I [Trebonia sp.]